MKLTKKEMIQLVAVNAKSTQAQAIRAVEAVIRIIVSQVATYGSFELSGLGTFRKSFRAEKRARGFGSQKIVPAHFGTTFKPSPGFKTLLNPPK